MTDPLRLAHDRATLVVSGGPPGFAYASLPGVLFDPRTNLHRAPGRFYRPIVEFLRGQAIPYALSNWAALERYPEDGDRSIDNNRLLGCADRSIIKASTRQNIQNGLFHIRRTLDKRRGN